MSGNGLGNQQRIMLARLDRLGSVATFEQIYQAGLLTRKAVRSVLAALEKRELVTAADEKGLIWITTAGHTARAASP
jgi:DNA-binding transcriptional ArsR family regulator